MPALNIRHPIVIFHSIQYNIFLVIIKYFLSEISIIELYYLFFQIFLIPFRTCKTFPILQIRQ